MSAVDPGTAPKRTQPGLAPLSSESSAQSTPVAHSRPSAAVDREPVAAGIEDPSELKGCRPALGRHAAVAGMSVLLLGRGDGRAGPHDQHGAAGVDEDVARHATEQQALKAA
jgi:hypothetical protein